MNRVHRRRRGALAALAGVLVLAGALTSATGSASPPAADVEPLECGSAAVQQELPNGAAWRMCARIHPVKGLVLEQVEFRPASGSREYDGFLRVLDEVYLAQLNVPYDTGLAQFDDITSYGFGHQYLLAQTDASCPGATLDVEQAFSYGTRFVSRTIPGICVDEVATGLAAHSSEAQLGDGIRVAEQGSALEVSSLSKISWYEYQQRLTFDDQGGIDVGLGATGDLAPGGPGTAYFTTDPATGWPLGGARTEDGEETFAASHWHSAIWRVDFGIGGTTHPAARPGTQFVERWDHAAAETGLQAPVTTATGTHEERAFSAVPDTTDDLTWWRVGNAASLNPDGHPRSYEIVNRNPANVSIPVTQPTLSVTNDRDCAQFASHNLDPGCPGLSVLDYVAEDSAPLTDPVAWVNVGFHHVDRDEDQSPMPVHWQRFQLLPRDFFAQSPSVTEARGCINGPPGAAVDSTALPCIATNVTRPSISASATPVVPGTVLTARKGLWIESRTTWSYAFVWFRDGAPIVDVDAHGDPAPAVGDTHVVTGADAGAAITVKVTASRVGFGSSTAESRPVVVAGGPAAPTDTPAPTPTPGAGPQPTATPPTTRVRASVLARGPHRMGLTRARARAAWVTVRVSAPGVVPSGTVRIGRGAGQVTSRLREGRARLRLPRMTRSGRHRFVVRYVGSARVAPASARLVVRVRRR